DRLRRERANGADAPRRSGGGLDRGLPPPRERALREGVRHARRRLAREQRKPGAAASCALLRDRRRRRRRHGRTADPGRRLRAGEGGRTRRRNTARRAERRPLTRRPERRAPRPRPGSRNPRSDGGNGMSTTETTIETSDLPDYAPVPQSALGPALNDQGYYVDRVERNLYWITAGTYQSAFLTTSDGVVVL